LCCCGRSMAMRGRTTKTTTRPAAQLLASWLVDGGWRMATRPTGHPDRYLATGKKYVVSTSNRVVINLKCGAPTKIRQAKLVARILTHAQKEKRSSAIERGGNKRGSVWHVRKANDEAVDFQQTFHLFAYLPSLPDSVSDSSTTKCLRICSAW